MASPSAQSGSVRLHIEDTGGSGRPVVLIHGWPLSAEAWKDQVGPLSDAGYRVIAYDRRGFGRSDKPADGYDYNTMTDDTARILEDLDLNDVTLVGFSMGGGEVARYVTRHGEARLRSIVFASSVTPFMMKSDDNPDGPLTPAKAKEMKDGLMADRDAFFDQFTKDFFSANGELKVTEAQRQEAITLCKQSDPAAALQCMEAFATTDFRDDLKKVTVPTLVLHGDADGIVPFEGSGSRTLKAIAGSQESLLNGAPHGCTASHTDQWNAALLAFLKN